MLPNVLAKELPKPHACGHHLRSLMRVLCCILFWVCLAATPALATNAPTITPHLGAASTSSSPGFACSNGTEFVTITGDSGASFFYTTDGTTPTSSSTAYSGTLFISANTTINAIAVLGGVSSSVSTEYVQIDPYCTPVLNSAGLLLWLKADFGVTTSGSNVTNWCDLSGNGNSAVQSNSSNQPTLTANASNSLPAITFDGTTSYMTFGSDFTNLYLGPSIYVVVNPTSVSAGARIFEFGNGPSSDNVYISEPNSTDLEYHVYSGSSASSLSAASSVTTNQFQVLTVSQNGSGDATILTNGIQDAQGSINHPVLTSRSSNYLGTDNSTTLFFQGQIAEVIVATQNSNTPNQNILAYLYARYGIKVDTPVITPGRGVFSTAQTVTISADPGAVIHYTTNGSAATSSSPTYSGAFSVSSSTTVNAVAVQSFGTSAMASSFVQIDSNSSRVPTDFLVAWFKSDNGVQTSGSNVTGWLDMSQYAADCTQSNSSNQPTLTSSAINGLPALSFDGSSSFLNIGMDPYFLFGGSGESIYIVAKPTAVAAGAELIEFGPGTGDNRVYLSEPSSSDIALNVYNGSTPSSLTSSGALTVNQFQLLEATQDYLGNAQIFSNGVLTNSGPLNVPVNTNRYSSFIGTDYTNTNFFQGEIAEILVYRDVLSDADRKALELYFYSRYHIKISPPILATSVSRNGLQLWLTADFGVHASGSKVFQWDDQSGSDTFISATQSNPSLQPTLGTEPGNGLAAVRFDGSSSFLQLPPGFSNLSSFSAFAVVKPSNTSTGDIYELANGSASNNVNLSTDGTSTSTQVYNSGSSSSLTASSAITTSFPQLIEAYQSGSSSGSLYVNGIQAASGSLNNGDNVARNDNAIGSNYNGTANFLHGNIQEILIYNRLLTTTEIANNRTYLLTKYGLDLVQPDAPVFSLSTGTLGNPSTVHISAPADCTILFTLDGTTPSLSNSTTYCRPIDISYSQTLKAIALRRNGTESSVTSASYTLDSTRWPAPSGSDTTPLNFTIKSPAAAITQ